MDIKSAYRDNSNFYFLPKKQAQLHYIIKIVPLYYGSPKPKLNYLTLKNMNPFEQGLGFKELVRISFSESNHASEIADFIKLLEDRNFIIC